MHKLSGKQFGQILNALLDTFRDFDELAIMVRTELGENLHEIASNQANLKKSTSTLIRWSESNGLTWALIDGAYKANTKGGSQSGHPALRQLWEEAKGWSLETKRPAEKNIDGMAEPSTQPQSVRVEIGPTVKLTSDELHLLQMLFANEDYARVRIVRKFQSGFSGAVVLLADPVGQPGVGLAPVVVKLAPYAELQREHRAYKTHIERAAPLIALPIQSPPIQAERQSGLGAIRYTYGGAPREMPLSFYDYYSLHRAEEVADRLDSLMLRYGADLWGELRQEPFWLATEYDRLLPVHFEVTIAEAAGFDGTEDDTTDHETIIDIDSITAAQLHTLGRGDRVVLRNFEILKTRQVKAESGELVEFRALLQADPQPDHAQASLRVLLRTPKLQPMVPGQQIAQLRAEITTTRQDLLNDTLARLWPAADPKAATLMVPAVLQKKISEPLPNPLLGIETLLSSENVVRWSVIHGDLNLQNILADPATGFLWLIDFAEARQGPTLYDIHRLTVQLITKVMVEEIQRAPALGPESIAYLLHELHTLSPSAHSPVPALQAPYTLLRKLREIASHCLEANNRWRFYYQGLWLALIGALRFEELDNMARQLVLIGAAKAKQLAELPVLSDIQRPRSPGLSPYQGLHYFDVQDANRFYGRKAITVELVAHLDQHSFLAVIGASGSGKSSLVRAGLVAELLQSHGQNGVTFLPPFHHSWEALILTPTSQPLKALARAYIQAGLTVDVDEFVASLKEDPTSLRLYSHRLLAEKAASTSPNLLLVVDQFEEILTLCPDRESRQTVIDNLLNMVGFQARETDAQSVAGSQLGPTHSGSRLCVVCTIRADFYAHYLAYPQLRTVLERYQKIVGPMTRDDLRQAIVEPANDPQSRWFFEERLVDRLLDDMAGEEGTLPLLSHALAELWERRRGRTLTFEGYHLAGGIRGGITKTADDLYNNLAEPDQRIVRRIFLSLTALGEGSTDTRRRANLAELTVGSQLETVQRILGLLSDKRLVTLDRDHAEVAHEAIIREWTKLHEWLEENREGLRVVRQLQAEAQSWVRSGQDASLLYRGSRLAQAEELIAQGQFELNSHVLMFIEASIAEREAALKAEEERHQLALTLAEERTKQAEERAASQAKRARNLRRLAVGLGLLLVVPGWVLFVSILRVQSEWQPVPQFPLVHVTSMTESSLSTENGTKSICVATSDIGIGCTQDQRTWNIYQQGLPSSIENGEGGQETWLGRQFNRLWSSMTPAIKVLSFDAHEGQRVYAYVGGFGVYRLDPDKTSWQAVGHSSKVCGDGHSKSMAVYHPYLIVVCDAQANYTAYLSDDAGQEWRKLHEQFAPPIRVHDVQINNDLSTGPIAELATDQGIVSVDLATSLKKFIWALPDGKETSEIYLITKHSSNKEMLFATYDSEREEGAVYTWAMGNSVPIEKYQFQQEPRSLLLHNEGKTPLGYLLLRNERMLFRDGEVIQIDLSGNAKSISLGQRPSYLLSWADTLLVTESQTEKQTYQLWMGHFDGLMLYGKPVP